MSKKKPTSNSFYKKRKDPLKRVESHLEEQLLVRLKELHFSSPELSTSPVPVSTEFSLLSVIPLTFPIHLAVQRNFKPFQHRGNDMEIDFAWPTVKVGIEVNGGIDCATRRSGHVSREGIRRDYYKTNLAQIEGWILLTFPPEYCTDDQQWTVGRRLLKSAFALREVKIAWNQT
jgi:hypothetical protein